MKTIILDQCAIIALQGGSRQAEMRAIFEDKNNLIFLQDANFREALQSGSSNYERIVKSVSPYANRIRVAPSHTEIMKYEVGRLSPIKKRWVYRLNGSEAGTDLVNLTLSGDVKAQDVLDDPRWSAMFNKEPSTNRTIMIQYYESLSDAVDHADRRANKSKQERIRYKFKQSDSIDDKVLEMTIKLAFGSIHHDLKKWLGDSRPYISLCNKMTYLLIHAITRWIRVCQQIQKGNMASWIASSSSNIINEYYDTLNISYMPLFDTFITHDRDSIATTQYLNRAITIYNAHRSHLTEYARTVDSRD